MAQLASLFIRNVDNVQAKKETERGNGCGCGREIEMELANVGTFSVVREARHIFTDSRVAAKIIKKINGKNACNEVACWRQLLHPNIVELFEYFQTKQHDVLIMEYVEGEELYSRLERRQGGLPEEEAKAFYYQLCMALQHCHETDVVHRDVKLENLLIGWDEHRVLLCDFGLAKLVKDGELLEDYCGSVSYTAPEILKLIPYDGRQSDVWSAGVVLFAMLTGYLPFGMRYGEMRIGSEEEDRATRTRVIEGLYHIPDGISNEAKELINMSFLPANKRIRLSEILQHNWFCTVQVPKVLGKDSSRLEAIIEGLVKAGLDEGRLRDAIQRGNPNPLNGLIKTILRKHRL